MQRLACQEVSLYFWSILSWPKLFLYLTKVLDERLHELGTTVVVFTWRGVKLAPHLDLCLVVNTTSIHERSCEESKWATGFVFVCFCLRSSSYSEWHWCVDSCYWPRTHAVGEVCLSLSRNTTKLMSVMHSDIVLTMSRLNWMNEINSCNEVLF